MSSTRRTALCRRPSLLHRIAAAAALLGAQFGASAQQATTPDAAATTEPGKLPTVTVTADEDATRTVFEKIPRLKPAFTREGTVTAANASKISDGAAAVVVTTASRARDLGAKPLARILAQSSHAQDPVHFTTAPVDAIRKVTAKAGLRLEDIDLFEINEAFAVVTLAANRQLGLDPERVNVHGGAIALGHPIGASGARLLVTLLHALEDRKARLGLATLCIGGGEASALVVERIP